MAKDERARWPLGLLLLSIGAMAWFEFTDGDLGFHLATGREILRSQHIPSTNVLSFTEPTQPWLLHQWLPALLFEWLWQHAGLGALMALKLIVLVMLWGTVARACLALGATPLWAAITCLWAASASSFRFELRPYLFTHLTLAIACGALVRWVARPASGSRAQLWAAAALGIGAQLHAGALDTALVLALFGLGAACEPVRARVFRQPIVDPAGLRAARGACAALLAGLAGAALLLALYHPWGPRVLAFPFEMATHGYWSEHLVEFRHAWKLPFGSLIAYWVWLAVVVGCLCGDVRRAHFGLWLCAAAYAGLSLWYARQAFAFGIVSAPLVGAALSRLAERWREQLPARVPALLLLLSCIAAPAYVFRDHTPGVRLSSWTWPAQHFAFVREHDLVGRAFVSDAWGGSFLGAFYPERRVFFDNRLEAYSDAFARDVYQRIRYGAAGWDALLDRYQIEFLVLRYTTAGEASFQRGQHNLRQLLARDPRYRLVYFDDVGELFVRSAGANAALADSLGIAGVDPDRLEFLTPPARTAERLLRLSARGEPSLTLLGLTALALHDAGDLAHARALAEAMRARAPLHPFTARVSAGVGQP